MRPVPRWRIAAAILVIAGLVGLAAMLAPVYIHNLELQNFVSDLASRSDTPAKSDDLLRTWVVDKAHDLDLPIKPESVRILRSSEGMRIDVRYQVRVDIPGYTVNLHFYPGAGSH